LRKRELETRWDTSDRDRLASKPTVYNRRLQLPTYRPNYKNHWLDGIMWQVTAKILQPQI